MLGGPCSPSQEQLWKARSGPGWRRGKHGTCVLQQLPVWGRLSWKQLVRRDALVIRNVVGTALDSLSRTPVSHLEGPGQASQQEDWLNPPSLWELHILISPWQSLSSRSARQLRGMGAQSQQLRMDLGKRLPMGLTTSWFRTNTPTLQAGAQSYLRRPQGQRPCLRGCGSPGEKGDLLLPQVLSGYHHQQGPAGYNVPTGLFTCIPSKLPINLHLRLRGKGQSCQ